MKNTAIERISRNFPKDNQSIFRTFKKNFICTNPNVSF